MSKHVVITKDLLPEFKERAKRAGVKLKGKTLHFREIKYIQPDRFHPKLWSNNWMTAYDVLLNGHTFNDIYILILDSTNEMETLYAEQMKLIRSKCIFLT